MAADRQSDDSWNARPSRSGVSRVSRLDPPPARAGNFYAYVDGQVLEARDPSGLAKDVARYGGVPDSRWATGCWHAGCEEQFLGGGIPGSYGGGDFDGNGIDDFREFSDYAWGWQLFENQGGTIDEYHALTFAIDHGFIDSEASARVRELLYFGRVGTFSDPTETEMRTCSAALPEVCDGNTRLMIEINQGKEEYATVSKMLSLSMGAIAWALGHEIYHVEMRMRGIPYDEPREERAASCYANRSAGRNFLDDRDFSCGS